MITTNGHLAAEYFTMLRATPQMLDAVRAIVPGVPDRRSCTYAQKREMEESEFKFGHGWSDWCGSSRERLPSSPSACSISWRRVCTAGRSPSERHTEPLWRLRRNALIFCVDNTNTKIVKSGGACLIFDMSRRGLLYGPSGCTRCFTLSSRAHMPLPAVTAA